MLSPMLVQFLVGLCCLNRNPDAVDIVLGDMVVDRTDGEGRDVDVTVTLNEAPGVVRAYMAYEVKHEKRKLDKTTVEQLVGKFRDMPQVTHKAIVSTAGFTKGACAKADYYGVKLFTVKPCRSHDFDRIFPQRSRDAPPFSAIEIGRDDGSFATPDFYVMELVPGGGVYAGALILEGTNVGDMSCVVVTPNNRTAGVHPVQLGEKHKNAIRRLGLMGR